MISVMVMVSHIVDMRWMSQGYESSRVEAHSGGEVAGQAGIIFIYFNFRVFHQTVINRPHKAPH